MAAWSSRVCGARHGVVVREQVAVLAAPHPHPEDGAATHPAEERGRQQQVVDLLLGGAVGVGSEAAVADDAGCVVMSFRLVPRQRPQRRAVGGVVEVAEHDDVVDAASAQGLVDRGDAGAWRRRVRSLSPWSP